MGDFLTAIWLCDVGNIALAPVEQQDEWLSGLLTGAPVRRAERVLRIAAPAARLESAAVTALLYYALAHPPLFAACDAVSFVRPQALRCAAKKTEDAPEWTTGPHGQPFPDGIAVGGFAAAAISEQPVGLDVQRLPGWPAEHARRIRSRIAHPGDPPPKGDDTAAVADCCRLWALKESAVKLTGEGFSHFPNSFAVTEDGGCYAAQLGGRKVAMRLYPSEDAVIAAAWFA